MCSDPQDYSQEFSEDQNVKGGLCSSLEESKGGNFLVTIRPALWALHGRYAITCPAATQSGSFLLDVDLMIDSATKPIKSSPFRITIFPGHAIPEMTQVVPGGSAGQTFNQTTVKFTSKATQWATFVVRSHDRFKNPLNAGGDHFVARVHGNTDIVSSEKRVEVIDQGCVSCSSTSVTYAMNIL